MKALLMAILIVGGIALVTDKEESVPAPPPVVEQSDPNAGPPGSVG